MAQAQEVLIDILPTQDRKTILVAVRSTEAIDAQFLAKILTQHAKQLSDKVNVIKNASTLIKPV